MHETGAPQFFTAHRSNIVNGTGSCVNSHDGKHMSIDGNHIPTGASQPYSKWEPKEDTTYKAATALMACPDDTDKQTETVDHEALAPGGDSEMPTSSNIDEQLNRRVTDSSNDSSVDSISAYKSQDEFFANVRLLCETDNDQPVVGPGPYALAKHRSENWPKPSGLPSSLANIYDKVRITGIPNALGARERLPSKLNLDEWHKEFGSYPQYTELLDFVEFGFPMGYLGPVSDYNTDYNHSSANDYPVDIDKFINKEISLGGVIGPIAEKPFEPWFHAAPYMSRPKRDSNERRVIADLSFPEDVSINAYILKNAVWGETRAHSLPTVSQFVEKVKELGPGSYMSTVDISRAYKNFRSDPLDWPLLCANWGNNYYCDITMPFGARASSLHMQSAANAIVYALEQKGVYARVYLDDIITLSADKEAALAHHDIVIQLLTRLGLPIARDKIQTPARAVEWLGININTLDMTISIPHKKVQDTLIAVKKYKKRRSMSKRELQSLIGRLIHVAKCVSPARLFVSRLLDALRAADRKYLKVTREMKADLDWFTVFCEDWNGISLISRAAPNKSMVVDASLTGIGGTDGVRAYGAQLGGDHQLARNISEIEALNIAVALHTLIDSSYIGAHVQINCDNLSSVQLMQTGKGRNKIMLDAARAVWMLQAKFDIHISYEHIRGKDNKLADALSRAHLTPAMAQYAQTQLHKFNITRIPPCMYIFSITDGDIFL